MKKHTLVLALFASLVCTGCYSHKNVLYPEDILESTDKIAIRLKNLGYKPSGTSCDKKTETVAVETYDRHHGHYSTLKSNTTESKTLLFADSLGHTAEYTVAYPSYSTDKNNHLYTTELAVTGCKTTNSEEYDTICNKIVAPTINATPITLATVPNTTGTFFVAFAVLFGGVLALTFLIL